MTSTPDHPPTDDHRRPEDQDEQASPAEGGEDLVDEETKRLSQQEAAQHDGPIDAQKEQTRDGEVEGGYGR